jgi:hypothetical protein
MHSISANCELSLFFGSPCNNAAQKKQRNWCFKYDQSPSPIVVD